MTSTKITNFVTPSQHPFHTQKWTIDLLSKNKRICKHVTVLRLPPPPRLSLYVDVINIWSLCVCCDLDFFSYFKKITILLFQGNKSIIKILLKDTSKQ